MMRACLIAFATALTAVSGYASAQIEPEGAQHKTVVVVLATGGTIAAQKSKDGISYEAGVLSIDAILSSVPEASDLVDLIDAKQVANIGSQDMSDTVWLQLLNEIRSVRTDAPDAAIIVTHGTDTIEETAFLLDLFFPSGAPIVLTGAMRSADASGADGPANLLDGLRVVSDSNSRDRGVLVVLNGKIVAARTVRKVHTESVEAFGAGDAGLLGEIVNGKPVYFAPPVRAAITGQVAIPKNLAKVGIIYAHGQMEPDLVSFYVANDYEAVVLAGVGNGNSSAQMIQSLKSAADEGLVVMRASRIPNGQVSRNVEVNDDQNGFSASHDLSPQKARILLSVLLSDSQDSKIDDYIIRCTTPLLPSQCAR